jgi:hypothetical protein
MNRIFWAPTIVCAYLLAANVTAPVASSAPSGATAMCQDGTYSYSHERAGTCDGHGGVSHWL